MSTRELAGLTDQISEKFVPTNPKRNRGPYVSQQSFIHSTPTWTDEEPAVSETPTSESKGIESQIHGSTRSSEQTDIQDCASEDNFEEDDIPITTSNKDLDASFAMRAGKRKRVEYKVEKPSVQPAPVRFSSNSEKSISSTLLSSPCNALALSVAAGGSLANASNSRVLYLHDPRHSP